MAYCDMRWMFAGRGGDVRGASPALSPSFTIAATALAILLRIRAMRRLLLKCLFAPSVREGAFAI
jgi:hypothetical protein